MRTTFLLAFPTILTLIPACLDLPPDEQDTDGTTTAVPVEPRGDGDDLVCLDDGEAFGPCVDGACNEKGLFCLSYAVGDMCVPACTSKLCGACSPGAAPTCENSGLCVVSCDGIACPDGLLCTSDLICVHGV